MLYVFKDWLERSAPGEFAVEVHLNATLFKQGTELEAIARGNLDMSITSAQELATRISHRNAGTLTDDETAYKVMARIAAASGETSAPFCSSRMTGMARLVRLVTTRLASSPCAATSPACRPC